MLSANILWLPIASKLKRVSEVECHQMEVVVEGVLAIQSGTSPRVVQQKLESLPAAVVEARRRGGLTCRRARAAAASTRRRSTSTTSGGSCRTPT
ncbi:hypothetical protein GCM10025868_41750 [Angustibacter aerolatus]|uniref:Uncharacterized protein n=1 Tax=Angustibacter aerolatus TaxID=1162965 RepID=A0ABQ6JNS8_9ACTN|nr:hypothetical protein GCM10025868_41750 [Angustibacter aerolatus]